MGLQVLCVSILALLLGLAALLAGYRLFLLLLPIWGFFAGFFIGAKLGPDVLLHAQVIQGMYVAGDEVAEGTHVTAQRLVAW